MKKLDRSSTVVVKTSANDIMAEGWKASSSDNGSAYILTKMDSASRLALSSPATAGNSLVVASNSLQAAAMPLPALMKSYGISGSSLGAAFGSIGGGTGSGDSAPAPRLPGSGGSQAEHALQEQTSNTEAIDDTALQDQSAGHKSPSGPSTRAALSPLARALISACEVASWRDVLDLLGWRDGYGRGPMAEGQDIAAAARAHHPEHGATPLHLLVAVPWIPEDGQAGRTVVAGNGQGSPGGGSLLATPEDGAARPSGYEQAVLSLLAAGADINAPSANGATALHWAAGAGNEEAVRLLLARGAGVHARTYTWRRQVFGRGSGQTALHWAAESNRTSIVELLSAYQPLLHLATDERGRTPRDVALAEIATGAVAALTRMEQEPWVLLEVKTVSSFATTLRPRTGASEGHAEDSSAPPQPIGIDA